MPVVFFNVYFSHNILCIAAFFAIVARHLHHCNTFVCLFWLSRGTVVDFSVLPIITFPFMTAMYSSSRSYGKSGTLPSHDLPSLPVWSISKERREEPGPARRKSSKKSIY